MKKLNPKKFLDIEELSALESQTLLGGHERPKKEKKKEVKVES